MAAPIQIKKAATCLPDLHHSTYELGLTVGVLARVRIIPFVELPNSGSSTKGIIICVACYNFVMEFFN